MIANPNSQPGGLSARELVPLFQSAGVLSEKLNEAKSARAKSTCIGNFLSRHVGCEVPIEVEGRCATATLRVTEASGNRKLYRFEVRWEDAETEGTPQEPSAGPGEASTAKTTPTSCEPLSGKQSGRTGLESGPGNDLDW